MPGTKPDQPTGGFTLIRRGTATRQTPDHKPGEDLLSQVEDGTVVVGPDGVQWIAMAAVPRRWERAKKPIRTSQAQSS